MAWVKRRCEIKDGGYEIVSMMLMLTMTAHIKAAPHFFTAWLFLS